MRPTRDDMFMLMAYAASTRGTCGRKQVGAIITLEARPISAGYNGPPSGSLHCDEAGCMNSEACERSIHAEDNAIRWARAFTGSDPRGATIYVTTLPCRSCAEKIVASGIQRVVYSEDYRNQSGLHFLLRNNVEIERCSVTANAISAILRNLRIMFPSVESDLIPPG